MASVGVLLGNFRITVIYLQWVKVKSPVGSAGRTEYRSFNLTHQGPREGAVGFIMGVRQAPIHSV